MILCLNSEQFERVGTLKNENKNKNKIKSKNHDVSPVGLLQVNEQIT